MLIYGKSRCILIPQGPSLDHCPTTLSFCRKALPFLILFVLSHSTFIPPSTLPFPLFFLISRLVLLRQRIMTFPNLPLPILKSVLFIFILLICITHSTIAVPVLQRSQSFPLPDTALTNTLPTSLDSSFISSTLLRPALFSRAILCGEENVMKWECGPCKALGKDVKPIKWGGDNQAVPNYLIAYDELTKSLVVAHRGTSAKSILSMANDVWIHRVALDASIFTNQKKSGEITVHYGFQNAFKQSIGVIIGEIKRTLEQHKFDIQSLIFTGHSQGAAITLLGSLKAHQVFGPSINLKVITFGLPRVGNQPFADYVDSTLGANFYRVTDRMDPVVILPPRALGFQHPSGEIHILEVSQAGEAKIVACPGQENEHCSAGHSISKAGLSDHRGPYFHDVEFTCPEKHNKPVVKL
ncbi:Alpha/Beta hydrolase protein [Lentinula aciculospora]|uniref:Alpha/Beta hydrolase protein n=1 Tax=Lentinula aciculospora TaxID=153920 RepID=A0A9W9A6R6_9AGAR|nr:Alpha/Beta hydrolase protein [Lentinula aciculospora]